MIIYKIFKLILFEDTTGLFQRIDFEAANQTLKETENSFLEIELIKNPLGGCIFPEKFSEGNYVLKRDKNDRFRFWYEPVPNVNYYTIDAADVYVDKMSIGSGSFFSAFVNVHQDSKIRFGNLKSLPIPKGSYRAVFPVEDRQTYSKFTAFF